MNQVNNNTPIVDLLENAENYYDQHPLFKEAFEFLRSTDLSQLPLGKTDLLGERLFYIVAHDKARNKSEAKLEAHRRYIDIQFVVSGTELMGWAPIESCNAIHTDYDEQKDITFFNNEALEWLEVKAGSFAIFFPEDAHAPLVGTGTFNKVIFKIAV